MSLSANMAALSNQLEQTSLSHVLQETAWAVPSIQTVHILSVATVISSSLFVSLHVLGISGRDLTTRQVTSRFLPVLWWTLPVLLITGASLIVAEPARSLQNPAFYLKMGLLLGASLTTLAYQLPMHFRADFWQQSALRIVSTKLLAIASLALWSSVILAGRWIAYVGNL
jgi:hypothetical protein